MQFYKTDEINSEERFMESLNKYLKSENDINFMKKIVNQFMNDNNTDESALLSQSLGYLISYLKDYPIQLNSLFIQRLMKLLFKNKFDPDNRVLAFRLISKILNYDTDMIESLLNYNLLDLIAKNYPEKYALKFCTKLCRHSQEIQETFLKEETFFYQLDDIDYLGKDIIKIYANFFSSLVRNIGENLPEKYFDFCYKMVRHLVSESTVRLAIIKALLTLIQASEEYEIKMIERQTFFEIRDRIKPNDELENKSKEEIEQIKKTNLFMEDITKLEISNLIEIFILLSKNHSDFLIENDFIDWFICFYHQNENFYLKYAKKIICPYATFLGDLAFYNEKIFQHPLYLGQVLEILEKFDDYHFQIKVSLLRLIYVLFYRAPFDASFQLKENDAHLILFRNISFTDFSDRLMVLNVCYNIFKNCPEDKISDLCQFAQHDLDFVDFLKGDHPENDDSQKVAELILQQLYQFDEDEN